MTQRTHVEQSNGRSRGPLVDSIRPYPDQLRVTLRALNGTSFWAYSLWRAPEGANLLREIPFSENYLQCAGSAEALTIELRTVDDAGTAHQYVLGRPLGTRDESPTEVISWDSGRHSTRVFSNEVFGTDEAADIFYAYFLTDTVPDTYERRDLGLR